MGLKERDDAHDAITQRINTGWGKVYVIVTLDDEGTPFEVFVNVGHSGGLFNAQAEALGKSTSAALRSGADPEDLVELLVGIRSGRVQEDNGDIITSIPDAVGVALKRVIEDRVGRSVRDELEGSA